MYNSFQTRLRAVVITLGCRVNQYESDVIAGNLEADGFEIVLFGEKADITIVNTCTVTAESDRKSRQHIRRAAAVNPGAPLIVTGCFAQVSPVDAAALPGVSAVVGNGDKADIPTLAKRLIAGEKGCMSVSDIMTAPYDNMTLHTPRRARAYIKIEDGCENHCSYCIIPAARGKIRSKHPSVAVEEAKTIAQTGCQEIIITGIETAAYGRDSGGAFSLLSLIQDLQHVKGITRITMGSLDPSLMKDDFLYGLTEIPSVLRHFHLSLQSGSSSVLRRMRRPYNADQAMDRIEKLHELFPDAMLSADVIVGFPRETEEEFKETLDFCRKAKFMHLHIFPYSIRRGTEAASMPGQLPDAMKKYRAAELASLQRMIKREHLTQYTSEHRENPVYVLVEEEDNGYWIGHSEHYVEVRIPHTAVLETGAVYPVLLTASSDEFCFGKIDAGEENAEK